MDDNFPTMEEYHLTLSRNIVLSIIIRVINATSPPGVHISPGEPVHDCLYIVNFHLEGGSGGGGVDTENGSSDFSRACL